MLRSLDTGYYPLALVMCRAQEMKPCRLTKLSSDQKGLPRVKISNGRQYLMFDHEKGRHRFRLFFLTNIGSVKDSRIHCVLSVVKIILTLFGTQKKHDNYCYPSEAKLELIWPL